MYNIESIANRTTLGGQASCLPLTGPGTSCSSSKFPISNFGRRGQTRNGFTLIELLVVISIIVILIALLLPALAAAKRLSLRILAASNMRQVGIAFAEYANENRGQYPPNYVANWPMGVYGGTYGSNSFPAWGLELLYYSGPTPSGNTLPTQNFQPGILNPTAQGVSLLFSTEPGASRLSSIPASYYNSNGLLINWSFYTGFICWIDHGNYSAATYGGPGTAAVDYSPAYDLAPQTMPQDWQWRNDDPGHEPVLNALSPPGSLLMTESAIFSSWATNVGLITAAGFPSSDTADLPASDNVVNSTYGPGVPDGTQEMYNDGSVRWVPISDIKVRCQRAGDFFGW